MEISQYLFIDAGYISIIMHTSEKYHGKELKPCSYWALRETATTPVQVSFNCPQITTTLTSQSKSNSTKIQLAAGKEYDRTAIIKGDNLLSISIQPAGGGTLWNHLSMNTYFPWVLCYMVIVWFGLFEWNVYIYTVSVLNHLPCMPAASWVSLLCSHNV